MSVVVFHRGPVTLMARGKVTLTVPCIGQGLCDPDDMGHSNNALCVCIM